MACPTYLRRKGALRLCNTEHVLWTVWIIIAALLTGSAGAQPISFVDISDKAGLTTSGVGHGVAVHDYDRDGWDDLFITTLSGSSRLFRNQGDSTFADGTVDAGLNGIGAYSVALWGDVDNDGLADLFLGRAHSGTSRLFRNAGGGVFEDMSEASGLDREAPIATATFGDVDGDGAIDLFLAVHNRSDLLYLNTKGEDGAVFKDVSVEAGIGGSLHTVPMQATWVDYDRDGDLDLLCVHDGRLDSRLYANEGPWPLRNVAYTSGIHVYPDGLTCCNMGTAWGDFDGDGWMDAYVTRIGKGGLFRNNGDGTFTDVAEERGVARNGMSWGVVWVDADNDGDLDLFIVNTSGYDGTPALLYENEGGFFKEIGRDAGASVRIDARGLASGDFNGDGRTDLVIVATSGRHRLLLNASENAGQWVKVNLRRHDGDTIGTRVEVVAGGKTYVRTISGGESYASQSSSTLHFGIGGAARVDTLRILWRGGRVEVMTDLAVDRTYTVTGGFLGQSLQPPELIRPALAITAVYPNPVRGRMHIDFTLADPGAVRIDAHDALGRCVAALAENVRSPGSHRTILDAGTLPNGTYFLRLSSGGHAVVQGIVVAK